MNRSEDCTFGQKLMRVNLRACTKIGQQKIGKTLHGLMSLDFSYGIQMVGSGLVSMVRAGDGVVMVWGIFFLAHFEPLGTS